MKPILCLSLVFAAGLWADEASDQAAIHQVLASLNDPPDAPGAMPPASFFTADADSSDRDRLANLKRRFAWNPKQPWSEVTAPQFTAQSIRFVTADVALVDAAVSQYGSTIGVRRVPVLLLMRRDGVEWKIAAVRNIADQLAVTILPVLR